ncbi:MAG: transketolase [Deltaproteobacteria bacterium]|jgi:transketolase|nr:transketolase [Deltaproteobacteria bacterium]MBW2531791.1 transketolase [Deltaproteobacteria bacterium]
MEIVSRPHRDNLVRWAAHRPEVVVLSADLTSSCEADGFREAYPQRFFTLGMAEQNLMGFAAGLAREGFRPFVHTFAVFVTRRPFDQVAMSIAYPNLPVRLLGFLPGITTPGGVTHQAIDDVALMRAMPNMTVVECADATEVESVLDVADAVRGPVYVRMLRGAVPRLFEPSAPLELDRVRMLRRGKDVALVSSGICTEPVMQVARALEACGVDAAHVHVSTLEPLADPALMEVLSGVRSGVVTVENHLTNGGLGSAVAERMAEAGVGVPLIRLGLRRTYAHGASRGHLMREYGLDGMAVVGAVQELVKMSLPVSEDDLAGIDVSPEARAHQAEDL